MRSLKAVFLTSCYLCLTPASYATEALRQTPIVFGPWHTVDLVRPEPHRFDGKNLDKIFGGTSEFNTLEFRKRKELYSRRQMLFRFIKDYKLIGMDRSKVHFLLGNPESVTKIDPPDKQTPDQEWYGIDFDCSLSGDFLELSYDRDKVAGYRSVACKNSDVFANPKARE